MQDQSNNILNIIRKICSANVFVDCESRMLLYGLILYENNVNVNIFLDLCNSWKI